MSGDQVKWTDVIQAFSNVVMVLVALIATMQIYYASQQVRITASSVRYEFLLRFFELLRRFDDIHASVESTAWVPKNPEQWDRVYRYLGLLETLNGMVNERIIEIEHVVAHYKHRIVRIHDNTVIQKSLWQDPQKWGNFLALVKRLP